MAEQGTHKPWVVSSNLTLATRKNRASKIIRGCTWPADLARFVHGVSRIFLASLSEAACK